MESLFENEQILNIDSFRLEESETFFDRSVKYILTNQSLMLQKVLNEKSFLKIFHCSLTTWSIAMSERIHFETNSNLYALILTLEDWWDILTLFQCHNKQIASQRKSNSEDQCPIRTAIFNTSAQTDFDEFSNDWMYPTNYVAIIEAFVTELNWCWFHTWKWSSI